MPDIRQIPFDEGSLNLYRQTCQTILRLVEMILRFCLVFTKYTVGSYEVRISVLFTSVWTKEPIIPGLGEKSASLPTPLKFVWFSCLDIQSLHFFIQQNKL